jgi:hypothetical protein
VSIGLAYLLPALSFAGASLASPLIRFHIPLIKPGVPFSGTRLSDKALVFMCCFTRSPTNDRRYVRWSWYSFSFWCRCWSGNRFLPCPRTLNFTHNH